MTISAISSNNSSYQTDITAKLTQRKQDFQNLASALQSGNLATAQQAFAQLQKDSLNVSQSQNGQNSGQTTPLQALASALQSGDLTGAQQAFSQLQQNIKVHHHHHHRQSSGASNTNVISGINGALGNGDNATSSSGQINVTA